MHFSKSDLGWVTRKQTNRQTHPGAQFNIVYTLFPVHSIEFHFEWTGEIQFMYTHTHSIDLLEEICTHSYNFIYRFAVGRNQTNYTLLLFIVEHWLNQLICHAFILISNTHLQWLHRAAPVKKKSDHWILSLLFDECRQIRMFICARGRPNERIASNKFTIQLQITENVYWKQEQLALHWNSFPFIDGNWNEGVWGWSIIIGHWRCYRVCVLFAIQRIALFTVHVSINSYQCANVHVNVFSVYIWINVHFHCKIEIKNDSMAPPDYNVNCTFVLVFFLSVSLYIHSPCCDKHVKISRAASEWTQNALRLVEHIGKHVLWLK